MKNIIEILGGAQILLGISFDPEVLFEERLSQEHKGFLALLRVIEEHLPFDNKIRSRLGRPRYDDDAIFRALTAKIIYQIDKNNLLRQRLLSDSNLRRICGFTKVPSEATFSRRLEDFSEKNISETAMARLVRQYHEGTLVRVIARDSTSIQAREVAHNRKKDVKVRKNKRGRPRKGEFREPKEQKRVERQLRQRPGKSLRELDRACGWGCKTNSQGKVQYTKGYKLHLDVSDQGIPISACVTGANVHDSQVAIPLEKMTERRVTHLYTMADSGYDFPEHRFYITGKGRVAVIDPNNRRSPVKRELGILEKEQYKARTVVERANSHLKDNLLPKALYIKGYRKVSFVLQLGVLCLVGLKILQKMAPHIDQVA
jgi:transposase